MSNFLRDIEFELGQRVTLPHKVAGRKVQGMIIGCEADLAHEAKFCVQYLIPVIAEGGKLDIAEVIVTESALAEVQTHRR